MEAPEKRTSTLEELLEGYRAGNLEAFNELYDRVAEGIYSYLRRRLRSQEMVDDVFQNILMKLHQSRSQYSPSLPALPWIFTLCRTVMIDYMRQLKRRKEAAVEADFFENHPDAYENDVPSSELPKSLESIKTISGLQKEALSLRFQEDLSFEEIAIKMKTSPANARQLISRAIKRLRQLKRKEFRT